MRRLCGALSVPPPHLPAICSNKVVPDKPIAALRASFGSFLSAAINRKLFAEAYELFEALSQYWDVTGLVSEAQTWSDRIQKAIEPRSNHAPEIETTAYDVRRAKAALSSG
jgi:hypothetical protein